MFFPTPVALRSYNAATTASTINRPAIRSVIATPGRHGSPSIKKKQYLKFGYTVVSLTEFIQEETGIIA